MDPHERVFNKLYLFNLLNVSGDKGTNKKFSTYGEAKQTDPYLKELIEKITEQEVKLLINRIEIIL